MRRLEPAELEAYRDLLDPALAERVRVQQVPFLPPGAAGMTIGRLVLVTRDDDRTGARKLLAHELVHVGQFHEHGFVGFLWRYLIDYGRGLWRHRRHRAAYLDIPFEREARTLAKRWSDSRAPKP